MGKGGQPGEGEIEEALDVVIGLDSCGRAASPVDDAGPADDESLEARKGGRSKVRDEGMLPASVS
jgi:hypothetical protein